MTRRIIILQGQPPAMRTALAGKVLADAKRAGAEVETCENPGAVATAAPETPSDDAGLLVLDPDVERPLAVARRIARQRPGLRFLFAVQPAREAALRREAVFGAPPGGRWSLLPADDDRLQQLMASELALSRQQRRHRTTLEHLNQRLSLPAAVDPGEYRRLAASDRYLERVLEHAHDGIISVDTAGQVVSWSQGAERLFGVPADQARHKRLSGFFNEPGAVENALAAALAGSFNNAEFMLDRGGALRYVEANIDALADDDGKVSGAVAIVRDTTGRREAEQQLMDSARQKDEFLAMLAHELRNPLAPIQSATQILALQGRNDPGTRQATGIISRQVKHMTGLINDLLDVARVTRRTIELDREVLPIAVVADDAIEQARTLIEARHHHFTLTRHDPQLQVDGDRKRLTQVLANLLINSAKYTPDGGRISLEISAEGDDVLLAVTDNGVGMDAALQSNVFDLFVQADRTPDRAAGGLGIGLALVKSLTSLHGGSVAARSAGPGRGSTFEVRLPRVASVPAADDARQPGPAAVPPARNRLKLMVVDDNEDAARSLSLLLEGNGHAVRVEVDPRAALQHARLEAPDAFILDIGMPHMDGYELARRLRALESHPRPMLIALTGYGQATDEARARDAGFDHHMVKPPNANVLGALLENIAPEGRR